jgi:GNAT superfamily N-acetyltransferase
VGRLEAFLDEFLGRWPPRAERDVVLSPLRDEPSWDGALRPVVGVRDGAGRWLLSVSPTSAPQGDLTAGSGVLRWSDSPAAVDPLGQWVPWDDSVVPDWLHPFGGDVLVETDDEGYVAGVGLKRHLDSGWEIAVGTEPRGRGRGLARRLGATAARRVLDEGRAVIYVHDDENKASAAAALAAGFPDLGWRFVGS